jgi:pimeloyl-ACP methyl ester carboxylesterase
MRIFALSFLLLACLSSCVPVIQRPSANELNDSIGTPPRGEWSYAKPARSKIRKAYQIHYHQPEAATVLFLSAARELHPYYLKSSWSYSAYQHALGMGLELTQKYQLWGQQLSYRDISLKLPEHCISNSFRSDQIDTLRFTGKYNTPALTPAIVNHGKGVSMVAHTKWEDGRRTDYPFLPKMGYFYATTAEAQWTSPAEVQFTLKNSRSNSNLSADHSAPLAFTYTATKNLSYQGLVNVFRPEAGIKNMGLFSCEPIASNRIPLILVHGLAATPNLWMKPAFKILSDPVVREKYQLYFYYYPTGLPLSHSAAGLKKGIRKLESYLTQHGTGANARKMVVIGHSMGGLLSSAITRDYKGAAKEIYTKNIEELTTDSMGKRSIEELLSVPPLGCITRVIFVATPHRGSKYADNWFGHITSNLIKIPKNILSIDPNHYRQDLTRLGKTIFQHQDAMDGVQRLRFNNPTLKYNLTRPKLPQVQYHSIIGDRGWGGELENSSDGVVAYSSSHLEGVKSELIVPTWHNAQDNDEAIAEIIRILRSHLTK